MESSPSPQFSYTDCQKCRKMVMVCHGSLDWQYICTCGTAFMFEAKDDGQEDD